MDFVTDWRFWAFVISALTFIGVVISSIINKLSNDKIANNHLAHIAEDIKVIIKKQKEQGEQINNIDKEVSYLKGAKETENKVIELLEKTLNK